MDGPLRVFVAAATADDRRRLRDAARRAGWQLVDHLDDAEVVLGPAGEWPAAAASDRSDDAGPLVEALTPREREVLDLLADGVGNREIAQTLGISEHTVKFHVSSIYTKLNVTNRAEAVSAGLRGGWIAL